MSSNQKLSAPIKSLQAKHRHLELQLARLSAEVANQHHMNEDDQARKRYVRQNSGNYVSPMDQRQGLSQPSNVHILSKDRSLSGNKQVKVQPQVNSLLHKVTSPQRPAKVVIKQGSSSKLERQKNLNDIIGHLKKNGQGQVTVKLSQKNQKANSSQKYAAQGASSTISMGPGTPVAQFVNQKSQNHGQNSATRQYYAGSIQRPLADGGSIELNSQLHNASVSNGSSRGVKAYAKIAGNGENLVAHQPSSSDADLNQLINLQGNTAAILGTTSNPITEQTLDDFDPGMSPVIRQHPHGPSGSRYQHNSNLIRSLNAAKAYPNFKPEQIVSPERQLLSNKINVNNPLFYRQQVNNFVNDTSNQTIEQALSNAGGSNYQPIHTSSNSEVVKSLEIGILNLHAHLKTLEGKYIDLANYYKQELISANTDEPDSSNKAVRSSSSMNQKRKQESSKRANSRESSQNNYMRSQLDSNKRTPRLDLRSNSKGSNGIRNFEEYKDTKSKKQSYRNYNQAEERSIIEEVKAQKQKLEGEMRNLIHLYTQICDEDFSQAKGQKIKNFQSRYSSSADEQIKGAHNALLNQILFKYQNKLLTQSEYQENYEKGVEKIFDELFEELSDLHESIAEHLQSQRPGSSKLPALSFMERIEKLGGDYDIQQEYSLSNLKETMFQIQHANDQFQLDLKKIGIDFAQIQKKLFDQERGLLSQLQSTQELLRDDLASSFDKVTSGMNSLSKRVSQNDQKLKILQESHGESVRYLREYRDNFRHIINEQTIQSSAISMGGTPSHHMGEVSGDQMSVNQSYGGGQKYQAEITALNQEVFYLRSQLADAKQHGLLDLNELRDKLDMLNSENNNLHAKVSEMTHDLASKNSHISYRDQQNAELVQKIQSQPNAHIFMDFWRQNCQQMVTLCHKFLHSMRRLQKVVHRKETNVQQEKQDFEQAKKELELNLKEVKRQLENQPAFDHSSMGTGLDLKISAQSNRIQPAIAGGFSMRNNPVASTSARPLIQTAPDQMPSGNYAQSMREHQPKDFSNAGQSSRPPFSNESPFNSQQNNLARQQTEQSQVPHKESQSQQAITDLKNENILVNKKLLKERQKVQNLLNELKLSQENLQKIKLTFVPQENVSELEQSVKQLQETIKEHEKYDQEYKKSIQELKMAVNDKQMSIYELTRLANEAQNKPKPDFQGFVTAVARQVNEVMQGQQSWLQSVEQHLRNKEQQMAQMIESIQVLSQTMNDKNNRIRSLLEENNLLDNMIKSQDEKLSSIQANTEEAQEEANAAQTELLQELEKLRGDLKVKITGNKMMNALMRGLKQKLVEELQLREQTIDRQTNEIQEYAQLVYEQDQEVQLFKAKLDTIKQKRKETKTLAAQTAKQLSELQAQITQSKHERDQTVANLQGEREQALAQLNQMRGTQDLTVAQLIAENDQLKGTLKVKTNGNKIMNALMRAFKQKIIEEKERQDQLIAEKESAIKKFTHQVQSSYAEVNVLRAKVEKKKFKQGQTKMLISKVEQDQQAIFGAKRQVEEKLATKESDIQRIESEKEAALEQLQDLQAELIQMQSEHQDQIYQLQHTCTSQETAIAQIKSERDKLQETMRGQLESLSQTEKANIERLGDIISRLQNDLKSKQTELSNAEATKQQLQSALKRHQDEHQALLKQHLKELEQTREKSARQTLESATIEQLESGNNQSVIYVISQLRIEVQQQRQINEQRDAQATDYNNKLTESNLVASQLKHQLESIKIDAKLESEALQQELTAIRKALTASEQKYSLLKQEQETQLSLADQTHKNLVEKSAQVQSQQERIEALMEQHEAQKAEQEQIQAVLRQDRDLAQAQLSDFINQNNFEKESLEGKLQHQVNQTLAQLNAKEDECQALQKQVNDLKELQAETQIEIKQLTIKLQEKAASLSSIQSSLTISEQTRKENQQTLEANRDLIVQFKAELQKSVDSVKSKDQEVTNLRTQVQDQTEEIASKDNLITEQEDDLNTLQGELQHKSEELDRALAQFDAFQGEIERLTGANTTLKDQIAQLKLEFQTKAAQLEAEVNSERQKVLEKDELIAEADNLLSEFNLEKHEVKAKFKHLMQIVSLKATASDDEDETASRAIGQSSYKGREDEVDLNHCFEELEQIVLEFKAKQESRIVELISDKEHLTGTIDEQKQDLQAMQTSLLALQDKMSDANLQVESNDQEARRQIDTAMRKIQKYKEELAAKKVTVATLETQVLTLTTQLEDALKAGQPSKGNMSDSDMQDSFLTMQKENMQLLERLQKTEVALQKARAGEPLIIEDSGPKVTTIVLSPEVAEKFEDISSRLMEIKHELHQAKMSCIRDLMNKFTEKLKAAQKVFTDNELLKKAIDGDKVTGWNNIIKECKAVKFEDKHFLLVKEVNNQTYHLVDQERITETAAKYLKSFIEDYDDDEFIQDAIGQSVHDIDDEPEIEKLKALVSDLRQDRNELQVELEQFREGIKADTSRLANLKDEEMKDDIEYLTGENKELQLKCKEVCLTKASLQFQLARARHNLDMQQEVQQNMSAIIDEPTDGMHQIDASDFETARNIGLDDDIFAPVQEQMIEESARNSIRRNQEVYSDQDDSILDTVNEMVEDDERRASQSRKSIVGNLAKALQRAETENLDLKMKVQALESQIEELNAQKEQDDEDGGQSLIPHIKVTLIQFLRNVGLTERQNEDLLTIIFNMMHFTDTEIQELKISRLNIKFGKGKPARAASTNPVGNSNNSNQSRDDDGTLKPPKRGLFGAMFGKKKQDGNTSGNNGSAQGGVQPPVMKPVARR